MPALTIEARTLGRRKALLDRWSVPLPPGPGAEGGEVVTLRTLIARLVRTEVAAFERRQQARQFVRVLSEREIAVRAAGGRVDPGGRPAGPPVDPDAAVAAALLGFEDGLYLVILDGRERRSVGLTQPTDGLTACTGGALRSLTSGTTGRRCAPTG